MLDRGSLIVVGFTFIDYYPSKSIRYVFTIDPRYIKTLFATRFFQALRPALSQLGSLELWQRETQTIAVDPIKKHQIPIHNKNGAKKYLR